MSVIDSPGKLSEREFGLLCRLFEERAGLQFAEVSRTALERRLGERVVSCGMSSFARYAELLAGQQSGPEWQLALDLVTTAETYFMRQEYQLRAFSQEILPILAEQNRTQKRLTIWSAGCATGEEVYSLAALVSDSELFTGWEVRLLGSDLSASRLAFAREASYRRGSFRAVEEPFRRRHFHEQGGKWVVNDALRESCQFLQINLALPHSSSVVGLVDVVFCRNVLIYMSDRAREVATQQLVERLCPTGFLFLGHSESLLDSSLPLKLVHLREDLAYQKQTRERP